MGLFETLKEKWIKQNEKMVCGAGFLHTGARDSFRAACGIHDVEYIKNDLGEQTKTRKEVDREFLTGMKDKAKDADWILTRAYLKAKAYLYYGLVRSLGGLFW